MFNLTYLFSVLFLILLLLLMFLGWMSTFMYLKFLVVLVYTSGIVIFILYISCMCWNVSNKMTLWLLFFSVFSIMLFDLGNYSKFSDVGEYLWMFLFFSLIFMNLVNLYSLLLFKVSGSLRF